MKSDNQQKAFDKFKRLKVGALFMKQGSGKTRVAVDLINSTDCELAIFLCPYSTKSNLEQEIHKWQLCKKYIIVGYETLSSSDRVYFELLENIKGKKVFTVADESVFIKNENSKRHMRAIEISKRSEYRLLLNGTPITKNEWDLYNQMMFLSPKIINMSRHEFLNTFFDHIQYKRKGEKARDFYKLSDVNIGYLHKLIAPYIFECDLIFDKDISRISVEITASSDAKDRYTSQKQILLKALASGASDVSMFTNLALSCFDDFERHKSIAQKLSGQIIVFCTLLSEVRNISKLIDCYVITGETVNRDEILEKFKNDNKPLLMTYGVGAYGLNLQFCNRLAFASLTFDYGKIDQAMMRIQRIGQTRDIEYTYFTSNLGVYSLIEESVNKKIRLHDLIIKKIEEGETFEKIL